MSGNGNSARAATAPPSPLASSARPCRPGLALGPGIQDWCLVRALRAGGWAGTRLQHGRHVHHAYLLPCSHHARCTQHRCRRKTSTGTGASLPSADSCCPAVPPRASMTGSCARGLQWPTGKCAAVQARPALKCALAAARTGWLCAPHPTAFLLRPCHSWLQAVLYCVCWGRERGAPLQAWHVSVPCRSGLRCSCPAHAC